MRRFIYIDDYVASTGGGGGGGSITIIGSATKSGGCVGVTVNKPTNTTDGDLMIMIYSTEDRTADGSAKGNIPAGWTSYIIVTDVNWGHTRVAYKVASGEGSSYTLDGFNKNVCIGILTVRGQASGVGWKGVYSAEQRVTGVDTASITTTTNNSLIIQVNGTVRCDNSLSAWANATNPLTWTEQWDFNGNRDASWCGGADGSNCGIATATQTTAGATGSFTLTAQYTSYSQNIAFDIKPA